MQQFIKKFKDQILGALSGFDRLVFRGLSSTPSVWDMERSVAGQDSTGDGRVSMAEQDSVQGLRRACETGK